MTYEGAPDLTLPRSASTAARGAFSFALRERTKTLLSLRLAELPEGSALRSVIAATMRAQPAAVFSAMRRTSVHVHFEAARFAEAHARAAHLRQGVASLLAELSFSGALETPVTIEAPARVVLRSARRTLALGGPTRFSKGEVQCHGADALTSAPITHHEIEGDLCLAEFDDNPLAMHEAHPNKEGNALDLGGHPRDAWIASLRDCLGRIATYLPEIRSELTLGLQQVVPVGYDEHRHLSASYREALGTIYLTLHPDPMTMTEALIHEFQHNKLNAALDLDPFLLNAFTETVVSPVRPDPRPLHGVVLAVHAFQPVAELYRRMIASADPLSARPRFHERLAQIHKGNHEGLTTILAHARPTAAGRLLLDEMQDIDRAHAIA